MRRRLPVVIALTLVAGLAAGVASAGAQSFEMLLLTRIALGVATATAGPAMSSLVGDYFPSAERGRIYSFILSGELVGAGIGFVITGDIAALSWRAAFVGLKAVKRLPSAVSG